MNPFPAWLEQFPYYLLIYLYHFVLPLTIHLTFATLFYVRNPLVYTHIVRELKDKLSCCWS